MTFPVDPKCRAGFVPMIAGLALMCIAAFDPRDKAFSSGRIPVVAAGLVFFLAGLAIVISGLQTRYRSTLLALTGTLLLVAFASVPIAIVWKSGATLPLLAGSIACLSVAGLGFRTAIREFRNTRRAE